MPWVRRCTGGQKSGQSIDFGLLQIVPAIVHLGRDFGIGGLEPVDERRTLGPWGDRVAHARRDKNFASHKPRLMLQLPRDKRMQKPDAVQQVRPLEQHSRKDVRPVGRAKSIDGVAGSKSWCSSPPVP